MNRDPITSDEAQEAILDGAYIATAVMALLIYDTCMLFATITYLL